MTDETDKEENKWEIAGLCIPAGLFIGMGIGWAYGNPPSTPATKSV